MALAPDHCWLRAAFDLLVKLIQACATTIIYYIHIPIPPREIKVPSPWI